MRECEWFSVGLTRVRFVVTNEAVKSLSWLIVLSVCGTVHLSAASAADLRFRRIQVTDKFWSEGAHAADFNRDGKKDVVSGPFWYAGPTFQQRYEYRPATNTFRLKRADAGEQVIEGFEGGLGQNNAYSDNFFTYTWDFNRDGWPDIFIIGLPGDPCYWYENPRGTSGHWTKHLAFDVVDNESPTFVDLTGDRQPELVCNAYGRFGYAAFDPARPTRPWTFHPLSPDRKYHKYNHGLGVGDVNGDGRADLLESNGWWEQPKSLKGDPEWTWHEFTFCPPTDPNVPVGGAQLYAYDVNGDGLNDVITCLASHGYGLAWYEQVREGGKISFRRHMIMNKSPDENRFGVAFSQPHAIDLVDMNRDGLKDIVTGKRFWAHGPTGDPEPNAPAVLYWFQLQRGKNKTAEFIPHRIDSNSGVGTQVLATDMNGDRRPDIVVGNKKGTFVFLQER
jgi:hypothetical protein